MHSDIYHDSNISRAETKLLKTSSWLDIMWLWLFCLSTIASTAQVTSRSTYLEMDSLRRKSVKLQNEGKTEEALTLLRRCDSMALKELNIIYDAMSCEIMPTQEELTTSPHNEDKSLRIITLLVLIDLIGLVFFFYLEKQRAYKKLVIKNQEWAQHNSVIDSILTDQEDKTQGLSGKERELFVKILDRFEKHKAYLDPDLNITDFSKALESNRNAVSKLINSQFDKSFSALLNEYRIKEAINILGKPENQRYTMQAISEMCGYHSRQVFYIAFKKETGVTPNEFVKMLRSKDFEE